MSVVLAPARPYDARLHITAGQLRRMGFYIPEHIHDEAYVRRTAVGLAEDQDLYDGGVTVAIDVLEPFSPYIEWTPNYQI